MTLGGRRSLIRRPHTGTWYRAVPPRFYPIGLGFAHSTEVASRFSAGSPAAPGFPVLYLTEDPQVALAEVRVIHLTGVPARPVIPNPAAGPRTVFPVHVRLTEVVDLCGPTELGRLDTSVQELTGDWVGYALRSPARPAPTQELGAALFATARVEAFLTYSARESTRRNLVVFPTKLRPGSAVEVVDPDSEEVLLSLP